MADDLDLYPTPPIPDGNATVSVEQAAAPAEPAPAPAGPSPAEPAPVDDPVSENGTTASRRLRPRRAKTPASTTAPTPSPQPTTPGRRARKPSRTASKKKTARKGAALATIQAQPQPPAEGAS